MDLWRVKGGFRNGLAVALLSAVLGLVSAVPALADPHDDKARVDRQLAQVRSMYESASTQVQAALLAYTAATAQLPAAQGRLAVTKGVVVARQAEARQAERDAAAARSASADAHDRYAEASGRVDVARAQVSDFVAAAYKGSGLVTMDSLLESRSPNDLVDRLTYLEKSSQHQQLALDGLLAARFAAKDADNQATVAQQKADTAGRRADEALTAAQSAQSAAEQGRANLTALINQQTQAMATATAQRDATLAQYAALKQESDQLGAQLRATAARSPGSVSGMGASGHFLTPVRGWISSEFGMRFDPFYHVWQLHPGLDFAAPGDSPIYAAADGQVAQAGRSGGYGNYTCLYHGMYQGKGLSTCYAHQAVILVRTGQQVHRGDVIGRVGSTGASTGNHLHFEVRVNGTPVPPRDWLDSCLC